ncbi:hypothetical protein BC827DRAFT_1273075 [Russula dissimulans]|nr:hypothetical protein BC827DRAFT_1273075 [Russula dissimulans]
MAIWSLMKEKIEKLLQQVADQEELLALLELTPIQIWNTNIDRFLEEWEQKSQTKTGHAQTPQIPRRLWQRGGGGDNEDGDDNFMRTKNAVTAKACKPIAPAGGASCARPKAAKAALASDGGTLSLDDKPAPAPSSSQLPMLSSAAVDDDRLTF